MREKGTFQPIIPDELFKRVQDILDGKRLAVVPHSRNNPDFPLRVFVRCGECGTPLTGSWSTGRHQKYAYYRCRKSQCRAVNVKRDFMEEAFYALLEKQMLEPGFMGLFREIVSGLWTERQKLSIAKLRVVTQRLENLKQRKNRLVEFFLDGRLDHQTYQEQVSRLQGESLDSEDELRKADLEQIEVEAILDFAESLLSRPHEIWFAASLEQWVELRCRLVREAQEEE